MNVTLNAQLEQMIRAKVESGAYESPSQVVEDALHLLEERDQLRLLRRERLLRLLADGVSQADNRQLVEGEEVFRGLASKTGPFEE